MATFRHRIGRWLLPVGRFSRDDKGLVLTLWFLGVAQGFAQSQAATTLPFTRDGLSLTDGEMSLLLGLARLAAFAALPLGWLGDRVGRRRPLLIAATLVIVGGAAAGLASDALQFGLSHAVMRTGAAALSGLVVVLLAEQTTPSIRAYAISFYGASISFGSGLALFALPLADRGPGSWRTPHLLVGVFLVLIPVLIRRLPESRLFVPEERPKIRIWRVITRTHLRHRFLSLMGISFLASGFTSIALAFSTTHLLENVGLGTGSVVAVSIAGATTGGIGFFSGGALADRWGRRNTSILAISLSLVGGLALYGSTSTLVAGVAIAVSAFGTFAFVPSGGSHRAELFPTSVRSTANTAVANLAVAGAATALLIGRLTLDTWGLVNTVRVLSLGMLVAIALTAGLPETLGRDIAAER